MTESKPYHYFDTPEGHDVFKKLWCVIKPATVTGIAFSTVDVLCRPKARSYMQILGRYAYITLPLVGMASAFVIVTNLAVTYRQKDDKINWVAGAVAAAGVFGAWRGSIQAGSAAVIGFSILALAKKYAVEVDYTFLPNVNHNPILGSLHAPHYDWSLTKERPRNWTRGE